jgi:hypothetical protein
MNNLDYDLYPEASYYGYRPDPAAAIAFIVIFSVLALAHLVQGWRYKYWIVYPTLVTGSIGEFYFLIYAKTFGLSTDHQVKSLVGQEGIGRTRTSICKRHS